MILAIDIGNTTVTLGGVRIAPQTRIFPRPTFGASSFPALFRRF